MQITDGISQYENHITQAGQNGRPTGVEGESPIRQESIPFPKGAVFEGVAIQIKDGYVTLSLNNGQSMRARLESGVNIRLGEPVLFEVKSNQENQIAIKQMPVASQYNPTLQKALMAAGLPVTERNLQMVNAMMEKQMPIDKSSLLAMARVVQEHPKAYMETLIQMRKLNFPITDASLQQFEAYKAGEHALAARFSQIMEQLPQLLEHGSGRQLFALQNEILGVLDLLPDSSGGAQAEAGAVLAEGSNTEAGAVLAEGSNTAAGAVQAEGANTAAGAVQAEGAAPGSHPQALGQYLTKDAWTSLEQQLKQIPGAQENGRLFVNGELNQSLRAGELLTELQKHLKEGQSLDAIPFQKLFQSREYKGLLRQAMAEQWMLEPEQAGNKENVDGLYDRLNRQMARLEQFLSNSGRELPLVGREVSQVRGNLEMMQQINQMFNYVQIPLKLQNQNAHSDLYVYTNKKKLQDREGELSALLHLELEHLGTTDVQIKMLGNKVNTHFYLTDDAALTLVEQHMEELTKRLEGKGYQCSVKVQKQEEQERGMDIVTDFLERESPIGKLQRYSFDVKA